MAITGEQFTIAAGEHEATLVEVGAGLRRYTHRRVDVTCGYDTDVLPPKGCGAVLVPWPNRIRGGRYRFDATEQQLALTEPSARNAIHGLGRWARWSAIERTPASVTLALDIVPQPGWPHEVRVEVGYALDAATGLSVQVVARNTGVSRAPFGAGFHPYLSTRGHPLSDVTLRLPATRRLILDEAQVPVGAAAVDGTPYDLRRGERLRSLRMDDCFTGLARGSAGSSVAEVRTRSGGAQLWADRAFGYLQVYTLDVLPGTGGPGVAVEPMSCAPDAFNSGDGLVVLEPGAAWRGAWGITPL